MCCFKCNGKWKLDIVRGRLHHICSVCGKIDMREGTTDGVPTGPKSPLLRMPDWEPFVKGKTCEVCGEELYPDGTCVNYKSDQNRIKRHKPIKCNKCKDTGVFETGSNDLPCDCEAGDKALFNDCEVEGGPITGAEMRRHFLNNSPEPLHGTENEPIYAGMLPGRVKAKYSFEKE